MSKTPEQDALDRRAAKSRKKRKSNSERKLVTLQQWLHDNEEKLRLAGIYKDNGGR